MATATRVDADIQIGLLLSSPLHSHQRKRQLQLRSQERSQTEPGSRNATKHEARLRDCVVHAILQKHPEPSCYPNPSKR